MSNKYCPAGSIECKYYSKNYCQGLLYLFCGSTQIAGYEQCPWPSRQVKIQVVDPLNPLGERSKFGLQPSQTAELQTKLHEVKSKIMEMEIREHIKMEDEKYNAAYLAGRREQARETEK